MEENKSGKCSPEPCDDVGLIGNGKSSEKSATDGEKETIEKSNKEVKRTWREGSEEGQFRGLLKEREDILSIPVAERSKQLMNRYRDVCHKIKIWKWKFPDIDSKRLTKAQLKKKANDKARLSTAEAKAKTKERMASKDNKAKNKERMVSEDNKAKTRVRMASEDNKAKTRVRMASEDNKANTRVRMASEDNKAKTRERMGTQENKDKTRERMAKESNQVADKERKAAITLANQLVEFRPQAPELKSVLAMEGYGGDNYCGSMRPTCIPGEPLQLKLEVKCFPAPVFIWKKDGKVIGQEVSGGSLLQRTKQVGGDAKGEGASPEVNTGNDGASNAQTMPELTKKYIGDSWSKSKGRVQCFTHWLYWRREADVRLAFSNTKLEDAGTYVVQVTNLHGTLQHSFDIDFRPILVRDIYPNEARVMVGGKLRLEAEISGGRITWYKDGEEVKRWKSTGEPRKPGDPTAHVRDDEISSLTIWECTMEDAGSYMGKTETVAGMCCTSSCQVTVEEVGSRQFFWPAKLS